MSILLTGGAGYIGSAVLERLVAAGHEVSALVRSPEKAAIVEAAGATAIIGAADDAEIVRAAAGAADGVIHLASSPDVDAVLVPAVLAAIEGRDARFVHTGGIWIYGSGDDITEESPFQPLPISGWRAEAAGPRQRGPQHGRSWRRPSSTATGSGIVRSLIEAPRGSGIAPTVPLVGDGSQHWTTVHLDDIADLLRPRLRESQCTRRLHRCQRREPHGAGTRRSHRRSLGRRWRRRAGECRRQSTRGWARTSPTPCCSTSRPPARGRVPSSAGRPAGASVLDEIASGSYAPVAVV